MKGNTVVQNQKEQKLQDEGKLAYMIAWRDRRIKALEELVAAEEQAGKIYAAYIAHLLERCGDRVDKERVLTVSKQEIRRVCGTYAAEAEDAGDDFRIILKCRGEEHDAQSSQVADA